MLLPNPTVFILDDDLGLLTLRQFSSAPNGIGLAVMERVRARSAVGLNGPATTGVRFNRDLRLSSYLTILKIRAARPVCTLHVWDALHMWGAKRVSSLNRHFVVQTVLCLCMKSLGRAA